MRIFTIKHRGLSILAIFTIVWVMWTVALSADDSTAARKGKLEELLAKNISVQFRNTPIEDVLRIMADQADVDIVKSPKVKGDVTVTLTDVPLEEALKNILTVHGFNYVLSENMIRVITSAEVAEKPEELQTETFEIVYADVTEVVKALEKFKSAKGSVSSIQGTSHVIVTDTESKIREIALFIDKIDRMTSQVLVEARIYDITSKDRYDLGIQWQAGRNTVYDTTDGITTIGTDPTKDRDPFMTGLFSGGVTKAENAIGALRVGWVNTGIDIDTILRAQQENIDAKLLANPRILVLDNETAHIKIISEIPYQQLTESSAGGTIGTTSFREVGVELEVSPHVAIEDEMIRLHILPTFSVVTGYVTVAGVEVGYNQPIVDRREADTTLLVKNGQTVVLGGLRKKDVAKQINKIPLLGDVPLVGALFRFKGESTITSELVVFITPWIVEQPIMTKDMTEDEKQIYENTKFKGPKPVLTKAEAEKEE